MTEKGPRQQSDGTIGRIRDQDAIEDGLDQQRHQALRRAGDCHQNNGERDLRPMAPAIRRQPQNRVHARTRARSIAPATCDTDMPAMPPEAVTASPVVRQGPQMAGSLDPNSTTTGNPKAAAI